MWGRLRLNDPGSTSPSGIGAADLSARIAAGDGLAEAELVSRYRSGVLVMLRRRVPAGEAEDLCQETLRIAIESLRAGRLREKEKVASYLWGIAHNLAERSRVRSARAADAGVLERLPDPSLGPDERLLESERRRLLQVALARLAARDREVLSAFYLRETHKADICSRMGISSEQFDVIKFRALKRLSRLFRIFESAAEMPGPSDAHS